MSKYGKVVIHQAEPSVTSSASRSSASYRTSYSSSSSSYSMDSPATTPRTSREEITYRDWNANKHKGSAIIKDKIAIYNRGQGVYDHEAPIPGYSKPHSSQREKKP